MITAKISGKKTELSKFQVDTPYDGNAFKMFYTVYQFEPEDSFVSLKYCSSGNWSASLF